MSSFITNIRINQLDNRVEVLEQDMADITLGQLPPLSSDVDFQNYSATDVKTIEFHDTGNGNSYAIQSTNGELNFNNKPVVYVDSGDTIFCNGYPLRNVGGIQISGTDYPILTTADEVNYGKLNAPNDWGANAQTNIERVVFSNDKVLSYDTNNDLTYDNKIVHTGSSNNGMDNPASENLVMNTYGIVLTDGNTGSLTMRYSVNNSFAFVTDANSTIEIPTDIENVKSVAFNDSATKLTSPDGSNLYWGTSILHNGGTGDGFLNPASTDLDMNNHNISNALSYGFADDSILRSQGGILIYNDAPVIPEADQDLYTYTLSGDFPFTILAPSHSALQCTNIDMYKLYTYSTYDFQCYIDVTFSAPISQFYINIIINDGFGESANSGELIHQINSTGLDILDGGTRFTGSLMVSMNSGHGSFYTITQNFNSAFSAYNLTTESTNGYLFAIFLVQNNVTLNAGSIVFNVLSPQNTKGISLGTTNSLQVNAVGDLLLNNYVIPKQTQQLSSTQDDTEVTIREIQTNWNTRGKVKGSLLSSNYECDFVVNYKNDADICSLDWYTDESKSGDEALTFEFDGYNLLLNLENNGNNNYKLTYDNQYIDLVVGAMSVSYNDITGTQDTAISNSSPSITNQSTRTLAFSVSPSLPSGLSLNSETGVISGTPTISLSATQYTITITDENSNEVEATFNITLASAIPYNTTGLYSYYNIRDNYTSGSTLVDVRGNANATLFNIDINTNVLESNYIKGICSSFSTSSLNGTPINFTLQMNARWESNANSEVLGRVALFNVHGNEVWYYNNSQVFEPVFPNLSSSISYSRSNLATTFRLWTFRFNATTETLDIFINKTKIITQNLTGYTNTTFDSNLFYVGYGTFQNNKYGLSAKDIMLYNRVLTDQEISDNYDDYFVNRFT